MPERGKCEPSPVDCARMSEQEAAASQRARARYVRHPERVLRYLAEALFFVAVFTAGYFTRDVIYPQMSSVSSDAANPVQLSERVEEVATILAREAEDPPTLEEATPATLDSLMSASGDAHADYYTPEEYARYLAGGQGSYTGIGVALGERDGQTVVNYVYPASPAEDAGIKVGDVIVSINGDRRDAWKPEEAVAAIGNEDGSVVALVVRRTARGGEERELTATMNVGTVDIPYCESRMLDGDIGYIHLLRFTRKAPEEMKNALAELDGKGAKGYIIDVRDNIGGYVSECVSIVSMFVKEGVVVQIQGRIDSTVECVNGGVICDKPVTILVNENSASAAEIFAAALQDHKRAMVVGVQTYGKGTVQTTSELSYGGAVKYTIAHYLSPDGHEIDGVGVTPDVVVEKGNDSKDDAQLQKALQVCQKQAKQ